MKCNLCGCEDFAYVEGWAGNDVSFQVCREPINLFACCNCGTIRVNEETIEIMQKRLAEIKGK